MNEQYFHKVWRSESFRRRKKLSSAITLKPLTELPMREMKVFWKEGVINGNYIKIKKILLQNTSLHNELVFRAKNQWKSMRPEDLIQ